MKTFTSFLKVLLAAGMIWLGLYFMTMGSTTTGLVVTFTIFVVSFVTLVAGILMAMHLLRREEDAAVRTTLLVLIPAGTALMFGVRLWMRGAL